MRVAVLSDVHANLEALQVVVEDVARRECDRILCLGDFVGYGPNPNECVELLRPQVEGRSVAGNHDWAAIGRLDITFFNPFAQEAIRWTQQALAPGTAEFLSALPTEWTQSGPTPFLAVHGSPRDPIEEYVLDVATAEENFRHHPFAVCFHGHSHVPAVFADTEGVVEARPFHADDPLDLEGATRYLINVGSVGQPRDGDPRAAYAVLDEEPAAVTLVRLPYNVARTQEKMVREGLPAMLVERLSVGR
ncbi:MAG TPA: metallophosphoesterase family protein [bacterium]|jgi:predicted phosphodiesterase|nr:metallophosphoesterase family protein [bacterium]